MANFNRYSLMMEALAELKPELDAARQVKPVPALPPLDEVLAEFEPMPPEALFLGVASDGLPILLNLHDPIPGPILVVGDAGAGKTGLLKSICHAAARMHQPQDVQFGVVTGHPDEWTSAGQLPNNVGVFPIYHESAEDFIHSLASWAHENKTSRQSVLLLLDDLEAALSLDFDARQSLRWLLLRGPARRVWPIITLSPGHMQGALPWLDAFHTRILGPIAEPAHLHQLDVQAAAVEELNGGSQFALREGDHWLRFWIPGIDK